MGAGICPLSVLTYQLQSPTKALDVTGFIVSVFVESCKLFACLIIPLPPGEAPFYLALAWVRSCALVLVRLGSWSWRGGRSARSL